MRKLLGIALLLVALTAPAAADMFPDASNAKLPEAQDNLGIARSVEAYGARCDGTTDDTAALQAAINANQLTGSTGSIAALKISGQCLTGPLTIGGQIRISGDPGVSGSGLTLKAGSTSALLTVLTTGTGPTPGVQSVGQIVLSHLYFTSQDGKGLNATRPNASGVDFQDGSWNPWIVADHVTITNMPGDGIRSFLSHGAVQGYKIYLIMNGANGLYTNSDNDFAFTDSQFASNLKDGILLAGHSAFRCTNCDAYYNTLRGILFSGASFGNLFGGMTDGNSQEGILFNNVTATQATNIYGTRVGNNSNGNPNLYSDMKFNGGAVGTIANLHGVPFTAPRPINPAANAKLSIEFNASNTQVKCALCDFAGNEVTVVGITNSQANLRTSTLAKTVVAQLPACSAAGEGRAYAVSDANSVVFNAPVAGGGTNHVMAYCDGTGWKVH